MRNERVLLTFARAHTNARVAPDEGSASGGNEAKKGCDKRSVSKTRDRKREERAKRKSERNRRSLRGRLLHPPPLETELSL